MENPTGASSGRRLLGSVSEAAALGRAPGVGTAVGQEDGTALLSGPRQPALAHHCIPCPVYIREKTLFFWVKALKVTQGPSPE